MHEELRSHESFDFDWTFHLGDVKQAHAASFDDSRWRRVNLPHDFSIEQTPRKDAPGGGSHGFFPGGVGWYRKSFALPESDRDRIVTFEFDGVYHNSDVWINGLHVGRREYGYTPFWYDVTKFLATGRNVIAVRVDNSDEPNCRWYSGSGIYRHVWMTRTAKTRVTPWGVCVTTPRVTKRAAMVRVSARVEGRGRYEVLTNVHDARGRKVAESRSQTLTISKPRLWSIESPSLYFARTVVSINGVAVDDVVTPFGIRDSRFDARRGFLLNGKPVKMKGVCLHHDGGSVGAAVPDRVLERRLEILKELGCNAIRCSHNPPARELLDLCDRMGFLVIDEAFDKWAGEFSKLKEWWMRQNGFAANWKQDLRAMLERDRNHPSIVMWSVGNETGQAGTSQVDPMLRKLVAFVRKTEPTRPVTCAMCNSNAKTLKQRIRRMVSCARHMDVLGLNYQDPLFEHIRRANPKLIICGTETFKYWRGGEMSVRTYDPTNPWYDVVKNDYVVGEFLWPGIDYLGESNTWPMKGWNTGIIDTCGFLKPEGWFQRSVWRDEPVVRIGVFVGETGEASPWASPPMVEHWNFPDCEKKLIWLQTQTNCQTVELIHNGQNMGMRRTRDWPNAAPVWFVPYAPGTLEAIGRDRGKIVARHVLRTSGPAARIVLGTDRTKLRADGRDVSHIEVELVDAKGVRVQTDDRSITFKLTGPGAIIGVDNGDMGCEESYKGRARSTLSGRCLVIVRATRKAGAIRLTASAKELTGAACTISCL